ANSFRHDGFLGSQNKWAGRDLEKGTTNTAFPRKMKSSPHGEADIIYSWIARTSFSLTRIDPHW
ncbi:hypothetical protein EI555_019190, partial [Monodon monoceros]